MKASIRGIPLILARWYKKKAMNKHVHFTRTKKRGSKEGREGGKEDSNSDNKNSMSIYFAPNFCIIKP